MKVTNLKKLFLVGLVLIFVFTGLNSVFSENNEELIGEVTAEDLGLSSPTILPGNPLYFLKSFARGLQRIFTLNSAAKAELELKFLSEKALEIKELIKNNGNLERTKKVLGDYDLHLEKLRQKLESLKDNSLNPGVNKLLSALADRGIKHDQLFQKIQSEREEVLDDLEALRSKFGEISANAFGKLDDPETFKKRIEEVIQNQKEGGVLTDFNAVGILSRLENKMFDALKRKTTTLKEDLILKIEGRFKQETDSYLESFFTGLKSSFADKFIIFDEIREWITDPDLKSRLNVIRQNILKNSEEGKAIGEEEANEIIEVVDNQIRELENKISSGNYLVSDSIKQILEKAKLNLEQAQKFYNEEQYGAAFGQATAAGASVKNGLNQLLISTEAELKKENHSLRIDFDAFASKAKEKGLTRENNSALYDLFDRAEKIIIEKPSLDSLRRVKILLGEIESILDK